MMKVEYDKYYQTENLFGEPYPELIEFYSSIDQKGKLLDVGCGQGRDSIPLARMGFSVTGIDNSKVGINQLNQIAKKENLLLVGIVTDIYNYSDYDQFDFILLDSMFHFTKKDFEKERNYLQGIIDIILNDALVTICIQDTGNKVEILNSIISNSSNVKIINQSELLYTYEDKETCHQSTTKYVMITIQKII